MLDRRVLGEILDTALQQGGDFADIFIENRSTTMVACEENRIERIKSGTDIGAGIRVIYGNTTAYAYTNKVTKAELLNVANIASQAAKKSPVEVNIDLRKVTSDLDLDIKNYPTNIKIDGGNNKYCFFFLCRCQSTTPPLINNCSYNVRLAGQLSCK